MRFTVFTASWRNACALARDPDGLRRLVREQQVRRGDELREAQLAQRAQAVAPRLDLSDAFGGVSARCVLMRSAFGVFRVRG